MSVFYVAEGKSRHSHIIKQFEPKKIKRVVDVFGGGGTISKAYSQRNIKTHYNDNNDVYVNIMETLKYRNRTLNLINELEELKEKNNEEFFYKVFDNEIDVSEEARLIYLSTTTHKASMQRKPKLMRIGDVLTYVGNVKNPYDFLYYPNIFKNNLVTSCMNYKEIIEKYKNDKNIFIYCDPPTKNGIHIFNYLKNILEDPDYKCNIMVNTKFTGATHNFYKNNIKHVYKLNNSNCKNINTPYYLIATNYPRSDFLLYDVSI
tara:strand:+ start:1514 stop:2296 length:783 start_codon:yes stop_codon:yes gene_type:complete